MSSLIGGVLRGALAGAAGVSALNAATYVDMLVRARPASEAPQKLVETVADGAGVAIPGDEKQRQNRLQALGPLSGLVTGVAVGAVAGALRAAGIRLPTVVAGPLLGLAAMASADLPLAVTKVSDPRSWSGPDWAADALPHLAYGLVTHTVLATTD